MGTKRLRKTEEVTYRQKEFEGDIEYERERERRREIREKREGGRDSNKGTKQM
jgi:hypothetical protein